MKRRNKIVQDITRNVANVFSFYAIIGIKHDFSMHKHPPGPLGEEVVVVVVGGGGGGKC